MGDLIFKSAVIILLLLTLTLNIAYQGDIRKTIKDVGDKCNTYSFSIPRGTE